MRMCVFPKWYSRNHTEPQFYPFEGTAPNKWDFTKFNPKFFQHLEQRVGDLRDLGIEADLILFHPYDEGHWGFDRMPADADDRYLHYVVARLAAYRNVWWSMANEWDFMKEKKETDFDRFFQIVAREDPYGHLRSNHNGRLIYDQNKPWVTHASIQNGSAVADFGRAVLYRDTYRKPVVFDEVKYEGDIEQRWGNLSAEEMVHRFWQGTIAGTYVGHSETYKHPQDILWWSKGGVLHGQSPPRIAFLRKVLESGPRDGLDPIDKWQDDHTAGKAGEYYLIYFGKEKPTEWAFTLPKAELTKDMKFRVEILDTWDMTVTPVEGEFTIRIVDGAYRMPGDGPGPIKLPGKQYMALRIRRAGLRPPPRRAKDMHRYHITIFVAQTARGHSIAVIPSAASDLHVRRRSTWKSLAALGLTVSVVGTVLASFACAAPAPAPAPKPKPQPRGGPQPGPGDEGKDAHANN
jgi:hypothetical protein